MRPLNKKLLRDLAIYWTQVLAIVVVVALGIIMFSGPLLAQRDLRESIDAIYRRTNYEDFSASVESAPRESVARAAALAGVRAVEGRLVRESTATVSGHHMTLRVISVPDVGKPEVNGLILESGSYLKDGEEAACLADHHLAGEFKLKPGSTVKLIRDGKSVPLKVVGSVVSPEYLRLVSGSANYVADPSEFGVVFVHYSEVGKLFGMDGRVNNYAVTVDDKSQTEQVEDEFGSLLQPYKVLSLTKGADEPSAAIMSFEISVMGKLALFFAVLLLAVASLALYITMTQIVFSQQQNIGVTRAVGYNGRDIMAHYLGYGLVLGVVGGALGILCGYFLSRLFIHIYAGIFNLPFITVSLYWVIALAGMGVAVAFSVLGAIIPARHAVRMKPAEAMRVEAGLSLAVAKHKAKEGTTKRPGAPSWLRVSLRNLRRNSRRTILTFLGVIATLCLMVTASGGKDSLDHAVNKYLYGVLKWDVAIVFSEPVDESVLAKVQTMNGVTAVEPALDFPARVSSGGNSADLQVQAFPGNSAMHVMYPTKGSVASPGPGQIVLNRGITKKLPVKLGDYVNVSTVLGSLPFKVAGFVSEPFGGTCYVNMKYVQKLAGADLFNVVLAKVRTGFQPPTGQLGSLPGVSSVITKNRVLSVFQDLVGSINTLFMIFYVMAFAMGFAVLFSMITVNVLERRREISTIRTLGAGRFRVFSFLTVEIVAVVVAALVPGILLGRLLEWVVIEKLVGSDRLVPDTVISGVTVAVIVAASLVVMILSELPSIRRLWHMDLARVTKERAD